MAGEIFISYRRADESWAKLLHSQLQAEGVEAWYDAYVDAGEDWRIATAAALESSRIFVLLFSSSAAQSSDIAKELAAAVLEKKLIIPVRLENIAPKGAFLYELASRNWVNAYENTEVRLAELAKGLAHLVRTGARDQSLLPFERADDRATRKRFGKGKILAAAAVAFVAVGAAAFWLMRSPAHWTVASSRPFISTLALEGEPAFSPDGTMLAYTSGPDALTRQIHVRSVRGGDGVRITHDDFDVSSPSWSSDGTRIAYVAQKPGEPCRIMVATVPAGVTREAGRCSRAGTSPVSWRPGTSFLYFIERFSADASQAQADAIFRLNTETGERQPVTRQEDSSITLGSVLYCSPDGHWLFFLRGDSFEGEHVVILNLDDGKETTLGLIAWAASESWSPSGSWSQDSQSVLVDASSGIGSKIVAFPINGTPPYEVYSASTNVRHLATGGGMLALETDTGRENLARAVDKRASQPDVIDVANGRTWSPTFAPDGTLAFLSNRSGTNAIWVMKPGKAPVQLLDAGFAVLFRVAYSPDGKQLAAVFARPGGATIKVLTAEGANVSSFDVKTVGDGLPTWTPDGKALVVFDIAQFRAVRVEIANPAQRTPVAPKYWDAVTLRNDGTFAARFDKPGVWQVDTGERLINSKYPARFHPPLAFRGSDVLIPDFDSADGARILVQPLSGGADRPIAYAPGAAAQAQGLQSRMAVNPVTGDIIYVASVQGDTNIDLLDLAKRR